MQYFYIIKPIKNDYFLHFICGFVIFSYFYSKIELYESIRKDLFGGTRRANAR